MTCILQQSVLEKYFELDPFMNIAWDVYKIKKGKASKRASFYQLHDHIWYLNAF